MWEELHPWGWGLLELAVGRGLLSSNIRKKGVDWALGKHSLEDGINDFLEKLICQNPFKKQQKIGNTFNH